MPETENRCWSDVATNRVFVGPFGTAQDGGATTYDRDSANEPHCALRMSIGENDPAGTPYHMPASYATAHEVELSSYVRAIAG